jgi:hypothetical protein
LFCWEGCSTSLNDRNDQSGANRDDFLIEKSAEGRKGAKKRGNRNVNEGSQTPLCSEGSRHLSATCLKQLPLALFERART